MDSSQSVSIDVRLEHQRHLETSILRALCRTVNAESSEVKYLIVDAVSENDFDSPLSVAIFKAVTEMYQAGEYVVAANLNEQLAQRSTIAGASSIEELFEGEIPTVKELTAWIEALKQRPVEKSRAQLMEESARTLPVVADTDPATTKPEQPPRSVATPSVRKLAAVGDPAVTKARPASETHDLESQDEEAKATTVRAKTRTARESLLPLSEGKEWLSYLEQLSSNQQKRFRTGFAHWDEQTGGLRPGLHLVVDAERDRVCAFLKQLTDQVAEGTETPCLYISFRMPKATLRLRTLSRLTGLPTRDIEGGSLEKTAPAWKRVEKIGRQATVWLNRIFIVEAGANVDVRLLREMGKKLLSSSGKRTGLIVIDDLGGLGMVNTSLLSRLRKVSESLALPLVVATAQAALLSHVAVECGASFREGEGTEVKLEMQRSGGPPVIVSLDYDPDTYRFEERSDS